MIVIDGVKVLNTIPAEEALPVGVSILVGVTIFTAIIILAIASCGGDIEAHTLCGLLAIGVVVGVGCSVQTWRTDMGRVLPETYQITVSDDVSFNDFNAAYEIISQDGEIFRVKIKET